MKGSMNGGAMRAAISIFTAVFTSKSAAVWLLLIEVLLLLAGAVAMPRQPEFEGMNAMPLLQWMRETRPGVTWWLWASVAVLSLLAVNTVACGAESVIKGREGRRWPVVLAPQAVHMGFLFMLLAHLMSAGWGMKGMAGAMEGTGLELPGGVSMRVGAVDMRIGAEGYPLDWRADVTFYRGGEIEKGASLGPNRPAFIDGLGVYLKSVQPGPMGRMVAVIEVTREPGAVWALVGGVLFTLGSVLLVGHKIVRER